MKAVFHFLLVLSVLVSCRDIKKNPKEDHPILPAGSDNQIIAIHTDTSAVLTELTTQVLTVIKDKSYEKLAEFIHPVEGLRVSPYAYIDTTGDQLFFKERFLQQLKNKKALNWGSYDGSGDDIVLTIPKYFEKFVYDVSFINAEKRSINKMLGAGNSLNNLESVYRNCPFVELYFSGFEAKYAGMDWRALRLVFKDYQGRFYLAGIVHDQWTI